MRRRHVLVLPALFVVTGLLAAGCDQSDVAGMTESSAASSGPGTPIVVPKTTQPDVIAYVQNVLGQARDLAAKGKTTEAARTVAGLQLQQSAWSRATQQALAPQIAEVQESLTPTAQ